MSQSSKYRPLLPAAPSSPEPPADPSVSPWSAPQGDRSMKRKRAVNQVSIACNDCRRRKARCDGKRPSCSNCSDRGKTCVYKERSRPFDAHRILQALKTAPESEAIGALHMLRADRDPSGSLSTTTNNTTDNSVSGSSSEDQARKSVHRSPPLHLEKELMAQNPVSYPKLQHLTLDGQVFSQLLQSLTSQERRAALDTEPATPSTTTPTRTSSVPSHPRSRSGSAGAINLCDARLQNLDITFWTDIPVSNVFSANVISLYLETDHPLLGTFDPNLFIGDLVDHKNNFCNRFLVHAVMYWGCQMYTAFDSEARDYVDDFGAATETIWAEQKHVDAPLNLAGAQLLSLAYVGHGKDHLTLQYLADANKMGTRLGYFGASSESGAASPRREEITEHERRAEGHAAWGSFNWAVLMSLFYQQPGVELPAHPPTLPIPIHGSASKPDNTASGALTGEIVELSPQPSCDDAPYMGRTFPALCRFWRIVHEVSVQYHGTASATEGVGNPSDHVSLEFAEYKYRELIAWAETLPESLVQSDECPHHVVIFHIWFHAVILDIFRPFARGKIPANQDGPHEVHHFQRQGIEERKKQKQKQESKRHAKQKRSRRSILGTFSSLRRSPDAAFKASLNQLKRLIVVYRSRFASSTYSMLWHTALIYVANAVLRDADDPEWRSYILLCIYSYERLRPSYRFAETTGRGILSLALRDRDDLSTTEARLIKGELEKGRPATGDRRLGMGPEASTDPYTILGKPAPGSAAGGAKQDSDVRATFMVDLERAMTNPEEATVEMLAKQFEDIALFNDFTTWDGSEENEDTTPVVTEDEMDES